MICSEWLYLGDVRVRVLAPVELKRVDGRERGGPLAFETRLRDRIEIVGRREGARVHLDCSVQGRFGAPTARAIALAQLLVRTAEVEPVSAPIVSGAVVTGTSAFAGLAGTSDALLLTIGNHEVELYPRELEVCAHGGSDAWLRASDGFLHCAMYLAYNATGPVLSMAPMAVESDAQPEDVAPFAGRRLRYRAQGLADLEVVQIAACAHRLGIAVDVFGLNDAPPPASLVARACKLLEEGRVSDAIEVEQQDPIEKIASSVLDVVWGRKLQSEGTPGRSVRLMEDFTAEYDDGVHTVRGYWHLRERSIVELVMNDWHGDISPLGAAFPRGYGVRPDGIVEDARPIEIVDDGAVAVIGGKRWRVVADG